MSRDGMNYSPEFAAARPVVEPGEFVFAASHFDHGHIYGQIEALSAAGGTLRYVFDKDHDRLELALREHPDCRIARDFREILDDPEVRLVTSAAIPSERCRVGLQVLDSDKEYFTDKCPFTTLEQLEKARDKVRETGRRYMVCYSERLLNEAAWHAGELIREGAIGDIVQVLNLAPHNLNAPSRPGWFFQKDRYGGILTDIGSHQFEQFLTYGGGAGGEVAFARVANFANPEYPELEDFGEASLILDNGVSAYCRIDWMNPAASRTWGDGRTFALGTDGYMELRKYVDVTREGQGNRIYLVNKEVETEIDCTGSGFPFFGEYILDMLNGTENAMTQEHAFKAAELSLVAQQLADRGRSTG